MDPNFKEWHITPDAAGKYPDAQVTHAILQDCRALLKSIRAMVAFFTVVLTIELVVGLLWALAR
ncbi:MAG TPA: hypothetical protein VEJ47_21040 [Candidatus Eremiobacteraceae bacterium]|nr:hypothetical protein [Candidatus Eremiobacteraceae bacterium]